MTTQNDSTPIVARIRFAFIVFLAMGALVVTLTSLFGETAVRNLILGSLICVFLTGGGLLGLLMTQHFSSTHLPNETTAESEEYLRLMEERRAEQELRRSKGFLGLFDLPDQDRKDGFPRSPRSSFRRSA